VEQCINCQAKAAVSHCGTIMTSFSLHENGTKAAKLGRNFNIPTTTLTAVSKNEDTIIPHFFISEYM